MKNSPISRLRKTMRHAGVITCCLLLTAATSFAQEIRANVTVVSNEITGVDKKDLYHLANGYEGVPE